MKWQVGEFTIQLAIQDWFRLDGGIIFSGIPREKWLNFWMGASTLFDERNRVQLPVNCFSITDSYGKTILVDTSFGSSDLWKPETVESFGMQNGFNLFECSHSHSLPQPDFVVLTHLHFDHAGGCVKLRNGVLAAVFPGARYIFHKDELKHALDLHPKTRSSYLRETLRGIQLLVDQERVHLMRETKLGVMYEGTSILFLHTRGHTPGHISVKITSGGQTAFIMGGLAPTRWHVNIPACGVGNDTHSKEAVDRKLAFLKKAVKENWLLLLEHDPAVAGRVVETKKGSYKFVPL